MARHRTRLLFLEAIVAVALFQHALGVTFYDDARTMTAADSVRIRAIPAMSTVGWGAGSTTDPVALRGVEYQFETKQPYEWFLKFNLHSYAGRHIKSAELRVTKCAASSDCSTHCKAAGKCSCATIFLIAGPDCGGGNIDEPYDEGSDDLHAWKVPKSSAVPSGSSLTTWLVALVQRFQSLDPSGCG
jgi:hypothetical protein